MLSGMHKISLHALPEVDKPWSIEEFIEKTHEVCRTAAIDLHRKSTMVEEAVEEVLKLVKNAANHFQSTGFVDTFNAFNDIGEIGFD